tara:strand:- start:239 stop:457 length:219 start_codon:yes stop_codon:yes gene_type:complete
VSLKKTNHSDKLTNQRITDHEKLCRYMQRETNKKIADMHDDIHRLEKIVIASTGFLLTSMMGIIVALFFKVF